MPKNKRHNYKEISMSYIIGLPVKAICDAHECDTRTLYKALRSQGVESSRKVRITTRKINELIEAGNTSITALSKALKLDQSNCRKMLLKNRFPFVKAGSRLKFKTKSET